MEILFGLFVGFLVCVAMGVIGAVIGSLFDRGRAGFWLGFFFWALGWIIIVVVGLLGGGTGGQAMSVELYREMRADREKRLAKRRIEAFVFLALIGLGIWGAFQKGILTPEKLQTWAREFSQAVNPPVASQAPAEAETMPALVALPSPPPFVATPQPVQPRIYVQAKPTPTEEEIRAEILRKYGSR
jgi:MFS family permease